MQLNVPKQIRLPSGHRLAYAEYGDPAGKPLFFLQGTPSSRLLHPDEDISRELGARVIVVDRPGFGHSDFQRGRRLLDWPEQLCAVADALGIGRFAIAGVSGGGPYALACAHWIPQRLTAVAVAGGSAPMNTPGLTAGMARERRIGYFVATRLPWLVQPLLWLTNNPRRDLHRFFNRYTADMCPADRAMLAQPEFRTMMMRNYAEATRAGLRGFAHEVVIVARPWGFRLEDIAMEVRLWHGELDTSTPLPMGRYMAQALPHCRATFVPGEGHFVMFTHWREIATELLAG